MHLSKPHTDGGSLVVNMVNPTAGMFGGDVIDISCRAEPGAAVVLTTPSAGRVFKARGAEPAVVRQRYTIRSGAFLEYCPELFIPHAGARCRQETVLEADAGGQLLFFEWLAPGRVASGEVFAYESLEWDTDLTFAGKLIARERYALRPRDHSLTALRVLYPQAHYLTCFACGLADFPAAEIASAENAQATIGWSALAPGAWSVKALCADNLSTRKCLGAMRSALYAALGRPAAALRRY